MWKLAFCVEDRTDEIIYQTLIARILEDEVIADDTEYRRRRGGGWSEVQRHASAYAERAWSKQLDGVLIVVDNDGAPEHEERHSTSREEACRRCVLPSAAREPELLRRPRNSAFAILYGVPVQILETWLLIARGFAFSGRPEARGASADDRRVLKKELYGALNPDRTTMLAISRPIAEAADLDALANRSASFRELRDQTLRMKRAKASSMISAASGPV
jgi:hypothetical protein